jgi:CMP-N,N'-diacetyllegionaminic acid synthase
MGMNLLVTICARAGSKGVKNKNIRFFLDMPLVYYTLAAYLLFSEKYKDQYRTIDLAVNTDSQELVNQISKTQISYHFIERESNQIGDFVSKKDVIKDTLMKMSNQQKKEYDYILDLDLTSPLRSVDDLVGVLNTLIQSADADLSFSITNSRRSPYFNMVQLNDEGNYDKIFKTDYVSRQQAPECFDMNASIYAYRRAFLLNSNKTINQNIKAVAWKMIDTAVLDIDSDEDFELMEVVAKYFYQKYVDYSDIQKKAQILYLLCVTGV